MLPSIRSVIDGTVRTSRWRARAASTTRRTAVPGALGHRDEEGLGAGLGDGPRHRSQAAVDADPGHRAAGQPGIVVEEPDRHHARARIAPGRPRQQSRRCGRRRTGACLAPPAAATRSEAARIPKRTPPRMATLRSVSASQNDRGNPSGQGRAAKGGPRRRWPRRRGTRARRLRRCARDRERSRNASGGCTGRAGR